MSNSEKIFKKPISIFFITMAVIILFYIISFRGIIFRPEYIYQNWDNGIPPFPMQLKNLAEFSKYTWWSRIDLGTPNVWGGMARYFDSIVFDKFSFFGGKFLSKYLYLLYAIVGGAGLWFICRELGWGLFTTVIVILLSQFNPKMYSVAVSGHLLHQGFGYSLIPWFLFLIYRVIYISSLWKKTSFIICAAIIGTFICSASPVIMACFSIYIILFIIAFGFNKYWWKTLIFIALISVIIIILHLNWLIPANNISKEVKANFKYANTAEDLLVPYFNLYHTSSPPFWVGVIGHIDANCMGKEYAYPVIGKIRWVWKITAYLLLMFALSSVFFRTQWNEWKLFSILSVIMGVILFAGDKTILGRFFYESILVKFKIVFFLMARPTRWLFIYYIGFALLLGFALDNLSRFVRNKKRGYIHKSVQLVLVLLFSVYWFPYLSGSITKPKSDISQTFSLMSQKVNSEEEKVCMKFSQDAEDYRIVILPTIAGPTGFVPKPPKSTYTRNFLLFGKDTMIGPVYSGEMFSRFLLNLMHRECPYTDYMGRLLGLGAVKRLIKIKDEKYYTYFNFGYMFPPSKCGETLFEPGDVLEQFLLRQQDLLHETDSAWKFDQVNIYKNADFLPRIRMVENAYLASGGMPLFVSMAETQSNFLGQDAIFFAADMDDASLKTLKSYWKGVIIYNNSWPELLTPFLSKDYWYSANAKTSEISNGWVPLKDIWHSELWFDGSILNRCAIYSNGKADITFNLKGMGQHRLFICYGKVPYSGEVMFYFNGNNIGSVLSIEGNRRGFIWKDLGEINLTAYKNIFKVEANTKGVVIRGLLLVPTNIFNSAIEKLRKDFLDEKDISIIAEAEAVAENNSIIKSDTIIVPLVNDPENRVKVTMTNTVNVSFDAEENRLINVAKNDQLGEVIFEIMFNDNISRCKLECYPTLYNDIAGNSFVSGSFSTDGINYHQIFERFGNRSGKRDDIYVWRQENVFECNTQKIFIKFQLRLSQLGSFTAGSHMPMRVEGEIADAVKIVKSWGQAVGLPDAFNIYIPRTGKYQIRARIIGVKDEEIKMFFSEGNKIYKITENGVMWLDMGIIEVNNPGHINIKLYGGENISCDLFNIGSVLEEEKNNEDVGLSYKRINPSKYDIDLCTAKSGILLFSESFYPKWLLKVDNQLLEPIKAFGFMNAYPMHSLAGNMGTLYFKYQPIREFYWYISIIGWIVISITFIICGVWWLSNKKRNEKKQINEKPI